MPVGSMSFRPPISNFPLSIYEANFREKLSKNFQEIFVSTSAATMNGAEGGRKISLDASRSASNDLGWMPIRADTLRIWVGVRWMTSRLWARRGPRIAGVQLGMVTSDRLFRF